MGLFDKKKNNPNEEAPKEEQKEVCKVTFPYITILIEDILSMTATEVSVIGYVRGGTLHEGQELYLLGRKGASTKTRALRIEDTLMTKMDQAEEGANVSIVLEGLRKDEVQKYDVLCSINCMQADKDRPDNVVNPFLKGLLTEHMRLHEDRTFISRVMEHISNDAIFITPCMHAPEDQKNAGKLGVALIRSTDGKMFLAAFTEIYEAERGKNDLPEKIIQPIDFETAKKIVDASGTAGMIINPKSDKFVVTKNMFAGLENVKKKIQNHLHEQKIDTSKPLMLAIPKDDHLPEELFGAMKAYMETEPRILRAWYGMMIYTEENKRNHLVIIDTLEEDPDIFGALGRAAKEHLDDLPLNMQTYQKVGEKMTEKLKLFYERSDSIESIK